MEIEDGLDLLYLDALRRKSECGRNSAKERFAVLKRLKRARSRDYEPLEHPRTQAS